MKKGEFLRLQLGDEIFVFGDGLSSTGLFEIISTFDDARGTKKIQTTGGIFSSDDCGRCFNANKEETERISRIRSSVLTGLSSKFSSALYEWDRKIFFGPKRIENSQRIKELQEEGQWEKLELLVSFERAERSQRRCERKSKSSGKFLKKFSKEIEQD